MVTILKEDNKNNNNDNNNNNYYYYYYNKTNDKHNDYPLPFWSVSEIVKQ